jgi:hypothetical protein
MRWFFPLIGSLLLISLAVYGLFNRPSSSTSYAYEYARVSELQRQQDIADSLMPVDTVLAVAWRLVPLAVTLGGLFVVARVGLAYANRLERERRPDQAGLLPVPVELLHQAAPEALDAYHHQRLADAQRSHVPMVPHSVNLSLHGAAAAGQQLAVGDVSTRPSSPVASFAQLLDAGRVGPDQPLMLGFDRASGQALEGSWLDLYSCAVGGLAGSGKTSTAAFLACQAVLKGARLVILDPHAENEQSLASRLAPLGAHMLCQVADTPKLMLDSVELMMEELERRRRTGDKAAPWLFLADEFSALQRGALAEPLGVLVEELGTEGRKMGLYGMVCGQLWTASRTGGTELRDSLASAYIHRLRSSQARLLSGLTAAELPRDLLELPAGSAYLLSTSGTLRGVTIPQIGPGDIARVAALATSKATSKNSSIGFKPQRSEVGTEVGMEVGSSSPLPGHSDAQKWAPEELAVLAAFKAGKMPGEIAEELAGGKGGRRYQEEARRVADIIRRALRQ